MIGSAFLPNLHRLSALRGCWSRVLASTSKTLARVWLAAPVVALLLGAGHAQAEAWRVQLPPPSFELVGEESPVLLHDGSFLLSSDALTRRFDPSGLEVTSFPHALSQFSPPLVATPAADALLLQPVDGYPSGGVSLDPDRMCRHAIRPWGAQLESSRRTAGRFAHGARALRSGFFAVYPTHEHWVVARFGPDCARRDLASIELWLEPPGMGNSPSGYGRIALVADRDGEHAFVRETLGSSDIATGLRITKRNAAEVRWSVELPAPESPRSRALFQDWSFEPTLDGGVLVFDGSRLLKLDSSGNLAWARETGHAYVLPAVWPTPNALDSAEPLLIELDSVILLEYTSRRFVFSPAGDVLVDTSMTERGATAPAALLRSNDGSRLLTGQSLVKHVSGSDGSLQVESLVNSEIWRIGSDGQPTSLLADDMLRRNELLLAPTRVLQSSPNGRDRWILDWESGERVTIPPAMQGSVIGEVDVHISGEAAYVFHGESSGPGTLTKLALNGMRQWSTRLFDELPNMQNQFAANLTHATIAAGGGRVCVLTSHFPSRLACADVISGVPLFESVEPPGLFHAGESASTNSPRSAHVAIEDDGTISVIALAVNAANSGLGDTVRRWSFDGQGSLVSNTDLDASSSFVEGTRFGVDPSATHVLVAKEGPLDIAGGTGCSEATRISRHRTDGEEVWTRSVPAGSWFPRGLADDGAVLLNACLIGEARNTWLMLDAAGQERWRVRLPDQWFYSGASARSLTGGDWLISFDDQVVRLSGVDGHEIWRRRLLVPKDRYYSTPLKMTVLDSEGLVLLDPSPRASHLIAARLADGEPVGANRLLDDVSVGVHGTSSAPVSAASSEGLVVTAVAATRADGMVVSANRIERIDEPDLNVSVEAMRGYWHDDRTVGQGLVVDIASGQRSIAGAWFTFDREVPAADAPSAQRWFVVQGALPVEEGVVEASLFAPAGGLFDSAAAAVTEAVGRIRLSLQSCERLQLTYVFDGGELSGLSGAVALRRTAGEGDCTGAGSGQRTATDGAWYDPATSGQGIFFQTVPDGGEGVLVGAWFAFDPEGAVDDPLAQHWFTLLGQKSNGSTANDMLIYRTIGGAFDQRATDNSHVVGRASFSASSCASGTLAYQFDETEVAGAFAGLQGSILMANLLGCTD